MPRRPMSLQYIAGFFDGEGNIRISKNGGLQISVAQKGTRGKQVLNAIRSDLTLWGVRTQLYPPAPVEKQLWVMGATGQENVLHLCRLLFPYLHVKRLEVQDHLRYYQLFPKMQEGTTAMSLRRAEGLKTRWTRHGF